MEKNDEKNNNEAEMEYKDSSGRVEEDMTDPTAVPSPEEEPAASEKLVNELTDKFQRTLAEFDNFRKRTIKEKASMYNDGVKDTVFKILPVIDNLERAVEACTDKEDTLYKGVEMILKQFTEVLEDMGVSAIDAVGEQFDPLYHNAVVHVEDENYGENEIVFQMQKGYMLKDKVIRHSMVKVAN